MKILPKWYTFQVETGPFFNYYIHLSTLQYAKRSIEAFKMMYVGFSRPTHLLCFAVLKGNLSDEQLSYFKSSDSSWSVIDLTEECNAPK